MSYTSVGERPMDQRTRHINPALCDNTRRKGTGPKDGLRLLKIQLAAVLTTYAPYSEKKLRTIHRSFGHPSMQVKTNLLRRSSGGIIETETTRYIEAISEACENCQKHAPAPRRIKLTVGTHGLRINHSVEIDTMFLHSKPVLQMVDLATHFCSDDFFKSQSTGDIWQSILMDWVHVYAVPPDPIHVDQLTSYKSTEMSSNMVAAGISLNEAPIETPGSIGTVDRYHWPLRAAFTKIWD